MFYCLHDSQNKDERLEDEGRKPACPSVSTISRGELTIGQGLTNGGILLQSRVEIADYMRQYLLDALATVILGWY